MTQAPSRTEMIERKVDREITGKLQVSSQAGGLAFHNADEVMEFAKLMSIAGEAVPPHCRNKPGVCLGIAMQAIEWRMTPFAVANKSYVVNDRISYESQMIHAVIEQRAPIQGRLKHSFLGDGPKRKCKVWATTREGELFEYESPEISQIKPKNSPLWATKPDLQLYYNTSRDWARAYFPDVILGVYSTDELMDGVIDASHQPVAAQLSQPHATKSDAIADVLKQQRQEANKESAAGGQDAESTPAAPAESSQQSNIEVLIGACQTKADCRKLAERLLADKSLDAKERDDWLFELHQKEQALAAPTEQPPSGDGQLFDSAPEYQ